MKKVFRLFISSTFDDFKLERTVLQRFVFPEIKKFLNEKEISFIPIDLRWGVPTEAQEDQKTMDICLNEVNRSAQELHPDFLVMIGDRYGWVPLPEKIEEIEFKEIERHIKNKERLNKWYKLDENQIPSSHILQPVYEVIDKPTDKERLDIWYKESDTLSKEIKSILNKTDLTKKQKEKYYLSATHQEYLFYKKISNEKGIEFKDTTIGYIKEIKPSKFNKKELEEKKFFESFADKEKEHKNYQTFKNEISNLPNSYTQIVEDKEIIDNLTEEDIQTIEFENLPQHLQNFANFVKETIFKKIEKELQKQTKKINFQKHYKNNILKSALIDEKLIGREKDIQNIKELLKTYNKIIISASSGTGKSALVAKLIDEFKDKDIIYRFCGVGEIKSIERLLKDILLNEFDGLLDEEFKELLTKKEDIIQIKQETQKNKLEKLKHKFLELTKDKLIILDAIDQLEDKEDELDWLPQNFIISVLNDKNYEEDSRYYRILKTFTQIKEYKLKLIENKGEIKTIILQKLKRYNRTITPNQLKYFLSNSDSKKPLYITIAIEELKTWRDDKNNENYNPYKENSKAKLSSSQKAIIKEFIKNLYEIHRNDELLVKRVFGYIYASQNHLDEELLLEVLSNDKEVMDRIDNNWHLNITGKLPDAVWARLRSEIINFLTEDSQGNLKFFHREFKSVSEKFYDYSISQKLLKILRNFNINNKVIELHLFTLSLLIALAKKKDKINFSYKWFKKLNNYQIKKYLFIVLDNGLKATWENRFELAEGYLLLYYYLISFLVKSDNSYKEKMWFSLNNLGYVYFNKKELIKAEKYFIKAKKYLKQFSENKNFKEYYSQSLYNLGTFYMQIGNYKESKKYLYESLTIRKDLAKNDEEVLLEFSSVLNSLGLWYQSSKNLNKAEKYLKEALEIREKLFKKDEKKYVRVYSASLNNLGMLYLVLNNFNLAKNYLLRSFEIRKKNFYLNKNKWIKYYLKSLNNLSTYYHKVHNKTQSKKLLEQYVNIVEKEFQVNPNLWIEEYLTGKFNLGVYYFYNNQKKLAYKIFIELLDTRKKFKISFLYDLEEKCKKYVSKIKDNNA